VVRDTLPSGRPIYRLLLTYKLSVAEAGKYKPTVPLLNK
jgi:tripeptidyl-peptidase-2